MQEKPLAGAFLSTIRQAFLQTDKEILALADRKKPTAEIDMSFEFNNMMLSPPTSNSLAEV